MRVKSEVDDRVNADCCLGEHGGDGQDVEGQAGLWDVAGSLRNRNTGIREPDHKERDNLKK